MKLSFKQLDVLHRSLPIAGKSIVHALAGIHPRLLIPIVVDVGCNTKEIRDDPLYIGALQV